jgi:hypothetical protein
MKTYEHLIGVKFGHLTIANISPKRKTRKIRVLCLCDCGKTTDIQLGNLVNGHTKSCGCLRAPHGQWNTKIWRCWSGIIQRCENINCHHYQNYGGRGITLHEPWHKFTSFLDYIKQNIGEPPTPEHSIDRIDNNKGYEPGNIKWSTKKEQSSNTRGNHLIEFRGHTKTLTQWSEFLVIPVPTLWHRLTDLGWPIERALTEPIHPRKKKQIT